MLDKLEGLLQSGTIKALIGATVPLIVVLGSLFGVDEAVLNSQLEAWAEKLLLILTLLAIAWAAWQRAFNRTPPLTESARQDTILQLQKELAEKGQQMIITNRSGDVIKTVGAAGPIIQSPVDPTKPTQRGFAHVHLLGITAFITAALLIAGCQHTRDAYGAADSLEETAYVISEHYAILREKAADLKDSGQLSEEQLSQLQALDKEIEGLVVGDPNASPAVPGIIDMARTGDDPVQLQRLIDSIVKKLTNLSGLIKSFGGNLNGSVNPSFDRLARDRVGPGLAWSTPRLGLVVSAG